MNLKNFIPQLFGAVGTAVNPKAAQTRFDAPNLFESTFLTGRTGMQPRSDIQTMEIPNQQGQLPLAGGYAGMLDPIKGITNPEERRFVMDRMAEDRAIQTMLDMTQGREDRDDKRALNVIKNLREQQYADRLKSRPLEFQELVAKNLLKTVTDLPGQVVRAGRMYDQEALAALSGLGQRPAFQETIRYFS